ncbi:4Fe-4S binding domain-containing protein [Desulfobaculum bizertense DSM 18034]|uniref:4Fe-4S binding domain-containing protein n=2 Tax=Desulfobaculum TaxID=1433996 RepID=A0A1T4VW42_9BACT|nr:4Fe-4S binding domain-containing protein [Desulfobaculum bizertense DSM 18034]
MTQVPGDGFFIEACRGAQSCPMQAVSAPELLENVQQVLAEAKIGERLRSMYGDAPLFHHMLKLSISYCPNGCSRPQIADIGLLGAASPVLTSSDCIQCASCHSSCREGALSIDTEGTVTNIDMERCVRCGACISACPSGAIQPGATGFRLQLGGKLGRHPRLALEVPFIFAAESIPDLLEHVISTIYSSLRPGERFADCVDRLGIDTISDGLKKFSCEIPSQSRKK